MTSTSSVCTISVKRLYGTLSPSCRTHIDIKTVRHKHIKNRLKSEPVFIILPTVFIITESRVHSVRNIYNINLVARHTTWRLSSIKIQH